MDPSPKVTGELGMMGFGHQEELQKIKTGTSDCSLAIDIANLSILAATNDEETHENPQVQMETTHPRKGTQRAGGGATVTAGGAGEYDKSTSILVHVAGDRGASCLPLAATPTAVGGGGGGARGRKPGKRRTPLIDPRRVLMLFATLSSLGTLVLLYFILSMGSMDSGDENFS